MLLLLFILSFSIAFSIAQGKQENNVCPTWKDYQTIRNNERCWYNPDLNAKPEAIAKRYGFILESHEIITPDGYILKLNRLVPTTGVVGNIPVLIHHGIAANAALWMIHGKTSTPFYLANAGYDVWLSNSRGTELSMRHVRMSPADPEFWDYSFHEIAVLDIPVTLEYIRKKRGDDTKITFIAHSMGGTVQFVYASMMPDHAKENVKAIISMAPVVYTATLNAPPALLVAPYTELLRQELSMLNIYGTGVYPQLKRSVGKICNGYGYIVLCNKILQTLSGISEENAEPEMLPVFFRRYPASFSIKSLAHFGQEKHSGGRFQMFDYGPRENLLRYNSTSPSEYNLEKINVPVFIIFGEADPLSRREDNMKLYDNLNTMKFIKSFRGANDTVVYSHLDFLYSRTLIELAKYLDQLLRNMYISEEIDEKMNKWI